eukprot:5075545-Alexandrium_andersonii.AAC.1
MAFLLSTVASAPLSEPLSAEAYRNMQREWSPPGPGPTSSDRSSSSLSSSSGLCHRLPSAQKRPAPGPDPEAEDSQVP